MAAQGRGLRAEDQPVVAHATVGQGTGEVQGAEPGGTTHPPLERAVGSGADVSEESGADRRLAVHPGLVADGTGPPGASGPSQPERQTVVRTVPGEPAQPRSNRARHPAMLRKLVAGDHQGAWPNDATFGGTIGYAAPLADPAGCPSRSPAGFQTSLQTCGLCVI